MNKIERNLMLMFGRNVKFYRMKNMMTQEELAEKSESSPVCISNYENGVNFPSARTMVLLAHALNVSVFMLFVDGEEWAKKLSSLMEDRLTEILGEKKSTETKDFRA